MNKSYVRIIALLSCASMLSGCGDLINVHNEEATVIEDVTEYPSVETEDVTTNESDIEDISSVYETGSEYDDIFKSEIPSEVVSPAYLVTGGYEFKIPASSYCQYFEDMGPAISVGDQLQYRIKVLDKSYEEAVEGDISAKAVSLGSTVLEGPETVSSNGFEYQYFVYELSGEKGIGINLPGPDPNHAIGVQIAILDDSVLPADAIKAAMSVVRSATITSKPDSTEEEIKNQYNLMKYSGGKRIEHSSIAFEDSSFEYDVPEGFYQTYSDVTSSLSAQDYESPDTEVMVTYRSGQYYDDAATYISKTAMSGSTVPSDTKLQSTNCPNGDVAYIEYRREDNEKYVIKAALMTDDDYIFMVEAKCSTRILVYDDIRVFFEGATYSVADADDTLIGPSTKIKHDQKYQGNVNDYKKAVSLIKQYGDMQRQTYNNPKVNEIESRLQSKYDIAAVNLGEMDIETASEIEDAVSYMFDTYPIMKGSLNTLSLANMSGRANNYIAVTQSVDFVVANEDSDYPKAVKHEILLNANKWLNREGMLKMCQNHIDEGYWFKNATKPSKVVCHELGHQLLNVLRAREYGFYEYENGKTVYLPCIVTEDNFDAYLDYYWSGTASNQTYEKELIANAYKEWLSSGHSGSEEDFRCSISQYANGLQSDGGISYQETFAEAIADVYVNKDNASDASKCIVGQVH